MASEGDIVLSYYDTCLRTSEVNLLKGNKWLNDNVIGFWFDYLENDLYSDVSDHIAFLSPNVVHFIKSSGNKHNTEAVAEMLASMVLPDKQLVLIPVNDSSVYQKETSGSHWSLLVFNKHRQSFEHYDSHTGSINRSHAEHIVSILTPIVMAGNGDGGNQKPPAADLELDLQEMECTQQDNNYDCGVHLICNAEAVCRRLFRSDSRHICEICSPKAIAKARRDLLQLIVSLAKGTHNSKK
ncbi:sentrin-specific protease 8-like [Oppia nitens]|uniref:sentrin-specific protease 8-like n=1 Tax=Oppia nitens TaxID=1686743 RepID=UPI0023D9EF09|nr:sentrin-specific protease 8-like [Oppia nitens]